MQCVYYERDFPNGFEEQFVFSAQMPYTVTIKNFQSQDIVPLHYAETIEVLLCDGLCGEIVIDNQRFPLGGQQLFVIPPYTIHANNIRPGDGTMYIFKASFRELERYMNIGNLLELRGIRLSQLSPLCPEYDAVNGILRGLVEKDGDLMACLPLVLELFVVFARHTGPQREFSGAGTRSKGSSLQELIRWTNEHYAQKISIDDVAKMTGYSKYHFCSRFKSLTGMTYMGYLNSVRISHACLLLRRGDPVKAVCRSCGFENVSYFIQVFKRDRHVTPYQYAAQQRREQRKPETETNGL